MPLGHPSDEEAAAVSPCRPAWAPQDHHEPILLAHLRQMPAATVRFRCELTELRQDEVGVHAVLVDRETATPSEVAAQYVIAADGAHSRVREQLGIGMHGPGHLADYERAEFFALGDRWGISRERTPGQPRFADLGENELTNLIARATGVADRSGRPPPMARGRCPGEAR